MVGTHSFRPHKRTRVREAFKRKRRWQWQQKRWNGPTKQKTHFYQNTNERNGGKWMGQMRATRSCVVEMVLGLIKMSQFPKFMAWEIHCVKWNWKESENEWNCGRRFLLVDDYKENRVSFRCNRGSHRVPQYHLEPSQLTLNCRLANKNGLACPHHCSSPHGGARVYHYVGRTQARFNTILKDRSWSARNHMSLSPNYFITFHFSRFLFFRVMSCTGKGGNQKQSTDDRQQCTKPRKPKKPEFQ